MLARDVVYSIRFRLLVSLFVLLGLSLSISMFGIWTYERDRYMDIARREAMSAGQTIEKALRSGMLANDWDAIQNSVEEIQKIVKPSVISIVAYDGTVAVSSDQEMIGRRIDKDQDPGCIFCHTRIGIVPDQPAVFMETAAGPVLRNVIKVPNGPECYDCHVSEQHTLGIVMYDALFADTYQMLRTVLFRTALTGLATFLLVILVLSWVIQRYVHRPVHQLMEGFLHVGRGNFNHWVDIAHKGEFQEMADQFNVMSHAIGRSFLEIRRKNWETSSLYAFVQQLSRAIEWSRLKRIIIELLFETFALERVFLVLRQEKKEGDTFEAAWRQTDDRRYLHAEFPSDQPPENAPDCLPAEWERWRQGALNEPHFTDHDTRAVLPLSSKNIAIGLLCLRRQKGQRFTGAEKKLLQAVAEQITIALANARLYRLAITDPLTGMYTRRYCEAVQRKFLDAHEGGADDEGFCILMLDLDHFKKVNDTHGHQVGDEILIQLAELIRSNIRYDDVACRYGGEEFIVLVAGGLAIGRETGQRLRQKIEEHVFTTSTAPPLFNTISIGVAHYPSHGRNGEEVLGAADQALYQAKEQGRNRVACFEAELEQDKKA